MQRPEDRPPKGGRPSLLSAEQQAEADRHRILGSLDGKSAAPAGGAKVPRRKPMLVWGAAGVGLVAIAAGGLAWLNSALDDKTMLLTAAAVPAAPVAAAAPRSAAAPAAAATPAAEPELSTAAILNDTAPAAPAKSPSLNEMLNAPSAAASPSAHAGGHDELAQALERPSTPAAAHKPQHAAGEKAGHEPEHVAAHKAEGKHDGVRLAQKSTGHKARAADKPAHKPVPAPATDSDVTLLAALMAHMQTGAARKADSPAVQLRMCKQQNSAGEEQCRARLCAGVARNEADCKAAPLAKAGAES